MSPTTIKHNKIVRAIAKPIKKISKKISPEHYVKDEYKYITGNKLNITNPVKYTEKLQFLRLYTYANNDLVSKCASRVGLREYVKEKGFSDNLVDIYGVFDSFNDIDFNLLPNQFVLKCTHASGFNTIIYDKRKINLLNLRKIFTKWLETDYGKLTVEPHYSKIKPQIIIEKLMLQDMHLPYEYKIHCFNGVAKYFYLVTGRDNKIHYNNYYIDWTPFDDAQFNHWKTSKQSFKKPKCWKKMVEVAENLSKDFPFVRVDLYLINNKIYISEMTFTPAKGTLTFANEKADYEIGEWLSI